MDWLIIYLPCRKACFCTNWKCNLILESNVISSIRTFFFFLSRLFSCLYFKHILRFLICYFTYCHFVKSSLIAVVLFQLDGCPSFPRALCMLSILIARTWFTGYVLVYTGEKNLTSSYNCYSYEKPQMSPVLKEDASRCCSR